MNPIIWNGTGNLKVNTYIGGVGGTINTPALLATKLGINVNRIRKFSVVGSDIQCAIIGSYAIPNDCFTNTYLNTSSPTYYLDNTGLVTSLGGRAFYNSFNTKIHYFPNVSSIGANQFYHQNNRDSEVADKILVLPRCTYIGNPNVINNSMFGNTIITQRFYASPFLQTNNAGGVDATIAYAIANQGLSVVWVTNLTAPNPITDLSAVPTTTTAVLTFTPPSSTNAIDYYNVFINGFYYQKLVGSTVTGLTTGVNYDIELECIDIYYNKSKSNKITVTTL